MHLDERRGLSLIPLLASRLGERGSLGGHLLLALGEGDEEDRRHDDPHRDVVLPHAHQ